MEESREGHIYMLKTDDTFFLNKEQEEGSPFGHFHPPYAAAVVSSLATPYPEANCHSIRCIAFVKSSNWISSNSNKNSQQDFN
jgi:hypothetical protein